jgi:hypothetical protein
VRYAVLSPVLARLAALSGADADADLDLDPEEVTLKQFCLTGLAEGIVGLAPAPPVLALADEFAAQGPAFFALLDAVRGRLDGRPPRRSVRGRWRSYRCSRAETRSR